jgi:hypothetical protein
VSRLTFDEAVEAAARAFAVDPSLDSIVIEIKPTPAYPTANKHAGFAAFHHDADPDAHPGMSDAARQRAGLAPRPVVLHGVYSTKRAAQLNVDSRGHTGQHDLELCAQCRVTVMGPEFYDLD